MTRGVSRFQKARSRVWIEDMLWFVEYERADSAGETLQSLEQWRHQSEMAKSVFFWLKFRKVRSQVVGRSTTKV